VSNTPVVTEDATTDTVIFLILGALRIFNTSMFVLRQRKFKGQSTFTLGDDAQGQILGGYLVCVRAMLHEKKGTIK
jgi:glyoxylate reductase